jgi:phenylacetate-CoA ligase
MERLYQQIPFLRPFFAGAYGFHLRQLRYGGDTERLTAAALERDYWSTAQWERWSREQLTRLLHHAATTVPYYVRLWQERKRRGDRSSWDLIDNWPILEKDDIRRNFKDLRSVVARSSRSVIETTSGTTGNPVQFVLTRDAIRGWYALCEARFRRWNNVTRHSRWAMIGAQMVTPIAQTTPPFWVWNSSLNQLYMSACHIQPANLASYFEAMQEYDVEYLWGHSSALDALARAALRNPRLRSSVRLVLSSSEPMSKAQSRRISKVFGCPVRETYGMSEMVAAASECSYGSMHLWPDAGYCEVVQGDAPAPRGTSGDLIATSLLNFEMPLIRYRVGDVAVMAPEAYSCGCGRNLPVLGRIEGRSSDVLYTTSGRSLSPSSMEAVFDMDMPVQKAQLIQESLACVRVLYVPDGERSPEAEEAIAAKVRERMGDLSVEVIPVREIPSGPNGKFRAVVCRLSADELRLARSRTKMSQSKTEGISVCGPTA